jgi:hypothetical protein
MPGFDDEGKSPMRKMGYEEWHDLVMAKHLKLVEVTHG